MNDQERNKRRSKSFNKFLDMLRNESDRGCVIVSAAIFDDILLELLKRKLLPSIEKKDELFENGSASFSAFSSRIDLAYRLGLVRCSVRATLHLIRKIRNDFAHVSESKTFDTPSVRSRIIEIFKLNRSIMESMEESIRENGLPGIEEKSFIEAVGTRHAYELLLSASAAYLIEAINDIEPINPIE